MCLKIENERTQSTHWHTKQEKKKAHRDWRLFIMLTLTIIIADNAWLNLIYSINLYMVIPQTLFAIR